MAITTKLNMVILCSGNTFETVCSFSHTIYSFKNARSSVVSLLSSWPIHSTLKKIGHSLSKINIVVNLSSQFCSQISCRLVCSGDTFENACSFVVFAQDQLVLAMDTEKNWICSFKNARSSVVFLKDTEKNRIYSFKNPRSSVVSLTTIVKKSTLS